MILIQGGMIHDGLGSVQAGDILIKDGRIAAVGHGLEHADAPVVDARGKEVFPGFIDPLSAWGCMGASITDNDLNEFSEPLTPELDAAYAFDSAQMLEQKLWEYGISSCGIIPTVSNILGGQAAVVKSWAPQSEGFFVKRKAAMVASVSEAPKRLYGSRPVAPMTKMGIFALLRQAFKQAQVYGEKQDAEYDPKSDALQPVLQGTMPLFVYCQTKAEMDGAHMALADYDVPVYLAGAYGLNAETPHELILGDMTSAITFKNAHVNFAELKTLMGTGRKVALSSFSEFPAGREALLWNGILAYQRGIDCEQIVQMLTSVPAKLLKVDHRVGSLAEGLDADIMIWSKHPLKSFAAVVERAFIGGVDVTREGRPAPCS